MAEGSQTQLSVPKAPFTYDGIIVAPISTADGTAVIYAQVEPAASRWLPLPGRTSRWWFEVHSVEGNDTFDRHTWAYCEGGSGGGFTFRSCVTKAAQAVYDIVERLDACAG